MDKIEAVTAYKFEGKLYETKEEVEKLINLKELEELIEKHYYRGINEIGILNIVIDNRDKFLSILNKI